MKKLLFILHYIIIFIIIVGCKKNTKLSIILEDKTVIYDGNVHNIEVSGDIPEGISIDYINNGQTEVGEYIITAKLKDTTGNYEVANELSAKLIILKKEITQISLEDKTVIYDGNAHNLEVSGDIPEGISIDYINNGQTEVGEYIITAKLKDTTGNYEVANELSAKLIIVASSKSIKFNFSDRQEIYNVEYGSIFTDIPSPPSKTGYIASWSYDFSKPIIDDVVCDLEYIIENYSINYNLPEGIANSSYNPLGYNVLSEDIILYSINDIIGKRFIGWYTSSNFEEETRIEAIEAGSVGNVELYPKFIDCGLKINAEYEMNYDYHLPAIELKSSSGNLAFASLINVDNNYSYSVYLDEDCESKVTEAYLNGNNTFYLVINYDDIIKEKYILNITTVSVYTFKVNDEVVIEDEVAYNSEIHEPIKPTLKGHKFIGWFVNEQMIEFPYRITFDIEVIAKFEKNKYKIHYYFNDDEVLEEEKVYKESFYVYERLESYENYRINSWFNKNNTFVTNEVYSYDYEEDLELYLDNFTYLGGDSFTVSLISDYLRIDNYIANETKVYIPDSMLYNGRIYNVKEINTNAFYGKTSVELLSFSKEIDAIKNDAFFGCFNLRIIYYRGNINNWCDISFSSYNSNPMYQAREFYLYSTNLNYMLSDNIVAGRIGDYQFYRFECLQEVNLSICVEVIGNYAFYGCSKLQNINMKEGVSEIGVYAFSGCKELQAIIIPSKVKRISAYTFKGCINLEAINLPEECVRIDDYAFTSCSKIKEIKLPNNLEYIGASAFDGCSEITNISIPSKITIISDYCFRDCKKLESIYLPETLISVRFYAFDNCSSLKKIYFSTKDNWDKIDIANGNAILNEIEIVYK